MIQPALIIGFLFYIYHYATSIMYLLGAKPEKRFNRRIVLSNPKIGTLANKPGE